MASPILNTPSSPGGNVRGAMPDPKDAWSAKRLADETETTVERIGALVDAGILRPSDPGEFQPGVPFRDTDGLTFSSPGTYKVMLTVCFAAPCDAAGGVWEDFPYGAATITVK